MVDDESGLSLDGILRIIRSILRTPYHIVPGMAWYLVFALLETETTTYIPVVVTVVLHIQL